MPHTFPTRRASVLAQANKATQAQSRIKRLAKLAGTGAVRAERSLHINFQAPARLPFSLLRLNEVDAGYRASAGHEDPDEELPDARDSVAGSDAVILHQFGFGLEAGDRVRSEEHTSELQSLMRISYAVFCLKKKKKIQKNQ